ncbi:MAG: hypothetical protein AAGI27_02215 [Pseudomonadota bacterium]
MFKTYLFGIVLGVIAAFTAVYFVPVVDQARENSVITVMPNGGNSESYHINIPMDRIAVGAVDQSAPLPPGMQWPQDFSSSSAELYKVRNIHDAVIGVASRVIVDNGDAGNAIEWVLHFPARGSLFVSMQTQIEDGQQRSGRILSGTREFGSLAGQVTEAYVSLEGGDELRRGRIELVSRYRTVTGDQR